MYLKNGKPQLFWIPALALPYTVLVQHSFEHGICVHIFRHMYTPVIPIFTVTYNMLHVHVEASVYACTHTQKKTDTPTHMHTHTYTHILFYSCALMHTRMRTHTRTHAHTHTLSVLQEPLSYLIWYTNACADGIPAWTGPDHWGNLRRHHPRQAGPEEPAAGGGLCHWPWHPPHRHHTDGHCAQGMVSTLSGRKYVSVSVCVCVCVCVCVWIQVNAWVLGGGGCVHWKKTQRLVCVKDRDKGWKRDGCYMCWRKRGVFSSNCVREILLCEYEGLYVFSSTCFQVQWMRGSASGYRDTDHKSQHQQGDTDSNREPDGARSKCTHQELLGIWILPPLNSFLLPLPRFQPTK